MKYVHTNKNPKLRGNKKPDFESVESNFASWCLCKTRVYHSYLDDLIWFWF